ncbi:hypothetical protein KCP75_10695 [Salmonella enterica subsp. enterica]|nr:hypothetical protein KCP75_10695 [Salmonella enterica subsp. enterica]
MQHASLADYCVFSRHHNIKYEQLFFPEFRKNSAYWPPRLLKTYRFDIHGLKVINPVDIHKRPVFYDGTMVEESSVLAGHKFNHGHLLRKSKCILHAGPPLKFASRLLRRKRCCG